MYNGENMDETTYLLSSPRNAKRLLEAIDEINSMSLKGLIPNQTLALQLAKQGVSQLIYDAVNLEGVAMTFCAEF